MITVSKVSHHTYLHVSDSRTIISEFFWWDVRRDAAMIETLNGTHETVNYRENTNLRIYDNTQFEDYPTHWHSPIEINMPVQNNYRIEYCDQTLSLREGDVMILCPGVLHHLFPAEGRRYIIQAEINPALNLREVDSILTLFYPALLVTPEQFPDIYPKIADLVTGIMKEYSSGAPFFEASIYAMLTRILVLIGRTQAEMVNRLIYDDTRQRQYVEKFMAVCRFIDEHCTEDLTLDEAAAYAGFSKYHFTRLFRQFAGTTFSHYMNQKRIAKAEKYLADPTQSVAAVAMSCGFSSMSSFIRMFKILKGCTPSEFRKMYRPTSRNLEPW